MWPLALAILLVMAQYPANAAHTVQIETRISSPDPQAGQKSLQVISVDASTCKVAQSLTHGTTDFFGITLASVRDKFVVSDLVCNGSKISFKAVGETASGVGLIPSIDYALKFEISPGVTKVSGCHDGYPGYKIWVDDAVVYDFKHRAVGLLSLFGSCDTAVNVSK